MQSNYVIFFVFKVFFEKLLLKVTVAVISFHVLSWLNNEHSVHKCFQCSFVELNNEFDHASLKETTLHDFFSQQGYAVLLF